MKIIRINRYLADVFTGEGWKNWTRVKVFRGYPTVLKGCPLDGKDLSLLIKQLQVK